MENLKKYIAKAKNVDINKIILTPISDNYTYYGLEVFDCDIDGEIAEYAMGTDEQCDDAWEETLESYIDEIILPELPDNMVHYFDSEKWKKDAEYDGRGHSLAPYDGHEIELPNNMYAYRIN
jgi:hypothetical protein